MDIATTTPLEKTALARRVGERVRALRKQRGWILADLAKRCGTTPQTIQRLESQNMAMTLEWVARISEALGVPPYELLADGALEEMHNAKLRAETKLASMRGAFSQLCETVKAAYPEEELRR